MGISVRQGRVLDDRSHRDRNDPKGARSDISIQAGRCSSIAPGLSHAEHKASARCKRSTRH